MSRITPSFRPSPSLAQRGFTLIEMMVAMAVGLIIVLALVTLLINVNRNNAETTKATGIIENGRFAIQILGNDIAHGGYWGGHIPSFDDLSSSSIPNDVPTAVPDPCLAYSSWTDQHKMNLVGIPVQVYEIPAAGTVPSVCSSIIVNPQPSTDVLIVRHAEPCVPGDTASPECQALAANKLYFQGNRCTTNTATFTLTAPTGTDTTTLNSTYPGRARDCTTRAELRRFVSTLYYVRNYAVTSGDGIPTLMRSEFDLSGGSLVHKTAEALVEGVQGFRAELGIDSQSRTGAAVNYTNAVTWSDSAQTTSTNRGDGVPEGSYVRCTTASPCTAAQLMDVVAVRLHVLARSADQATSAGYRDQKTYTLGSTTLGPYNDQYKRHVFTQTIRLMNVSSRRETP